MSVASIILHFAVGREQKLCNFSLLTPRATKPHKMIKKFKIIATRAVPMRVLKSTDIIAIANNSIVVNYIYWKCGRIKLITIGGIEIQMIVSR